MTRSPKNVSSVNFWPKYEENVPVLLKDQIFEQYFSEETMYVYCDMSTKPGLSAMSVACSYVKEGSVLVKHQYVYPPKECHEKNIFGEIKSIMFALTHCGKYIGNSTSVIIYSDIMEIEKILSKEITFKKSGALRELQNNLIILYRRIEKENPTKRVKINYLNEEIKRYNPFYKSAHNAAKKLIN